MKVIWFNTHTQAYQFGSYEDFKMKASGMPNQLLALERFGNASESTLAKIVFELNKCLLGKRR